MAKEIIKQLEAITHRGYSAWNVFEDWISLMFYALQRNDDEYLKIVRRYKNDRPGEREIDYFCKAFALLMSKMQETNEELLGEIYTSWEVANKHNGQFFTPPSVSKIIAKMLAPKGGSISDPCCGAGIMLVYAAKEMTNKELDKAVFVGQDIDFTCVKMCALNFVFFNLNGYVIWGNTITNERRQVFRTVRSYMGGSIVELDAAEFQQAAVEKERKEVAAPTVVKGSKKEPSNIQVALF